MTTTFRTLQSITTGYSIFEKDQVLTDRQLNSVTDYLNDQTRLNRVYLLGVGIVTGLQVSLSGTNITLTKGIGITTDGDLLSYANDTLFDRFLVYDNFYPKYAPFYTGGNILSGTILPVFELVPQNSIDSRSSVFSVSEFTTRTTRNLSDMVAILLMESYVNDPDLCTGTDCDNLGQDCLNTPKLLLISKTDLNILLNPAINTPDRAFSNLSKVVIERPQIPTSANSAIAITQVYLTVCNKIYTQLAANLPALYANCASFIGDIIGSNTVSIWLNQLTTIRNLYNANSFGIQYLYDFLKDFATTYNELLDRLFGDRTWTCPDLNAFPKHLLIGNLVPIAANPEQNRFPFYPSPLLEIPERALDRSRFLARKLGTLIQTFQAPTASASIRVTPSGWEDRLLEERAIPYYYSVNNIYPIQKHWNYDLSRRKKETENYSYNASAYGATGGAAKPLEAQIGQFSFFRIEGHVGQNLDTAFNTLSTTIQTYNLPFRVIRTQLGEPNQPGRVKFLDLLALQPSIEHFAGVTRGGTFVLLGDANTGTVIADFLLPDLSVQGGGSSCTINVKPSDNLSLLLTTIATGQDAVICFGEGTYRFNSRVVIQDRGHITIRGAGKATRILTSGLESALEFVNCKSVSVSDCHLENPADRGGISLGFATNQEDLRGILTFINCPNVEIEKVSLRCAHQVTRSSSCITVRQPPSATNTQVRIRNCDLEVGYRQIGILLINVDRSLVENNRIQVDLTNSTAILNTLLTLPEYRLRLLPRLIANAYIGTTPPRGGATRDRYNQSPAVTVTVSGQSIRFKSEYLLPATAWQSLVNARISSVQNPRALLQAVKQLARQVLLDDTFRSTLPAFNNWYQVVNSGRAIVADQGIVVAGVRAREIRILNNSLQGFLQGIHIGISPRRSGYRAGSILITGNRIEVSAFADQICERHGIYVSSCDSLIIENNYLQAASNGMAIEGIRISGILGRTVIIRQNHLVGFSLGIYLNPLDSYGANTVMQWLVSDNMAPSVPTFIQVVSNRPGQEGQGIINKVRRLTNFQ